MDSISPIISSFFTQSVRRSSSFIFCNTFIFSIILSEDVVIVVLIVFISASTFPLIPSIRLFNKFNPPPIFVFNVSNVSVATGSRSGTDVLSIPALDIPVLSSMRYSLNFAFDSASLFAFSASVIHFEISFLKFLIISVYLVVSSNLVCCNV